MSKDINNTITDIVVNGVLAKKGKKSSVRVVAVQVRTVNQVKIKPFSR